MALTLVPSSAREGASRVSGDHPHKTPSTSAYVIESIEYVPDTPLPRNSLFDNPVELGQILDCTRRSIESQPPSWTDANDEDPRPEDS